ncbi:MAG: hypothetical protein HY747_00660, partial [Elusimicrobia bacterium]|nr:hypothetical protein [Elusimicrobiota bacterium]
FTDEEIRRETAHWSPVQSADGKLSVREQGTVYNEMISAMESPNYVNWNQIRRKLFGRGHPLAREYGGLPEAMRELRPEDIRRFHKTNYHLGPNMALIAVMPVSWSAAEFLSRLEGTMEKLQPGEEKRNYPVLPDPAPERPEILIGRYPSDEIAAPQEMVLAWKPLAAMSERKMVRTGVLLDIIAGGETSFLHRDLVDQKTKSFDSGLTGVYYHLGNSMADFPVIGLDGLSADRVTPQHLARLRDAVMQRIKSLGQLKKGVAELAQMRDKARSLIRSYQRADLEFMDESPGFGSRYNDAGWHRRLDMLNTEPGFEKDISRKKIYDELLKEIEAGENPWTKIAQEAGLFKTPLVSAVKPDPGLAAAQKKETEERIRAQEGRLKQTYGTKDLQEALARFKKDYDRKTQELEARDQKIRKPSFVKDPPLTLDELDYSQKKIKGIPLVRTHFGSTPFTSIHYSFDLSRVPADKLHLLAILPSAIGSLGVTTRDGKKLDYVKTSETIQMETGGVGFSVSVTPTRGRAQLSASASASSAEEIEKAGEWLENHLLRSNISMETRERLIDLVKSEIQGCRGLLQDAEENWAQDLAAAYAYQDQPVYMALESPFTSLYYLNRLRWRLEGPSAEERSRWRIIFNDYRSGISISRKDFAKRLEAVPGEMGEFLRYELSRLPPDSWSNDMARILRETQEDLDLNPGKTISELSDLVKNVLSRRNSRALIIGNTKNADRAESVLKTILSKLPKKPYWKAAGQSKKALVFERLKERMSGLTKRPVFAAFVRNGNKTGVHVLEAPAPSYSARRLDDLLIYLAMNIFSGGGAHGFFMKTWSAGLAYSNGLNSSPRSARTSYYADRSASLAQTMSFVTGLPAATDLTDPFLAEYALAESFTDYRRAKNFSSRGWSLANDLADGITPGLVRGFKKALVKAAAKKGVMAALAARLPSALGRVLPGYGPKVASFKGAMGFAIGPEELLAGYEQYLKYTGEADSLPRLYPRDFWPQEATPGDPRPALSLKNFFVKIKTRLKELVHLFSLKELQGQKKSSVGKMFWGIGVYKIGVEAMRYAIPAIAFGVFGSPMWAAIFFAARGLIEAAANGIAGSFVAKYNPAKILSLATLTQGLIVAGLIAVLVAGLFNPWIILALYVLEGAVAGVGDTAKKYLAPELVSNDEAPLRRYNARLHFFYEIGGLAGGLVAGTLGALGYFQPLLILPPAYLIAAWIFSRIRTIKKTEMVNAPHRNLFSFFDDFGERAISPFQFQPDVISQETTFKQNSPNLSLRVPPPAGRGNLIKGNNSNEIASPEARNDKQKEENLTFKEALKFLFKNKILRWSVLTYVAASVAHRIVEALLIPNYAKNVLNQIHYSGYLLTLSNLGELIGAVILMLAAFKIKGPLRWSKWLAAGLAGLWAFSIALPMPAVIALLLMFSATMMLSILTIESHFAAAPKNMRGPVLGLTGMFKLLATTAAIVLMGLLFQNADLFWVMIGFNLFLTLLAAAFLFKKNTNAPPERR